jgi:hypothetical protein
MGSVEQRFDFGGNLEEVDESVKAMEWLVLKISLRKQLKKLRKSRH